SRHPDVLRGHGARGAGKRRAPGLSAAPRLPHGLPPGAAEPGGAGRRLRALRVVLRLQAPPPPRRCAPPPADGGGLEEEIAEPASRAPAGAPGAAAQAAWPDWF